jgi:hypothetical protein
MEITLLLSGPCRRRIYRSRALSHLWLAAASESPTFVCGVSNEYGLEELDVVRGFGRRGELDAKLRIIKDEAVRCTRPGWQSRQ